MLKTQVEEMEFMEQLGHDGLNDDIRGTSRKDYFNKKFKDVVS